MSSFFIRQDINNDFIQQILNQTSKIKNSFQYKGYIKVSSKAYNKALVKILKKDASDIIEMLGLQKSFEDLKSRIEHPKEHSSFFKVIKNVFSTTNIDKIKKLSLKHFLNK